MKLAVSACLLAHNVRYDGGHKRYRFITDELSAFMDFTPFCPEDAAFGTPRESIRLLQHHDTPQTPTFSVIGNQSKDDKSAPLRKVGETIIENLNSQLICGIIFKAKSPSCGFGSAKRYLDNGHCEGKGDGLFVLQCRAAFDYLPMEEEMRLQDAWLRENFMMQVFAYDAMLQAEQQIQSAKALIAFHTRNKYLLYAKNEPIYREMGQLIGRCTNENVPELLAQYALLFKQCIATKSSIKRNRNILEHMAGFFKRQLSKEEKRLLHEQISDYANRIISLITPICTIKLLAAKYDVQYILEQTFLEPYPKTLALRSAITSGK